MTRAIVVFGGGGHARVCIDLLRAQPEVQVIGVLDSVSPVGSIVGGVPVLGDDSVEAMRRVFDRGVREAVVGVGALDHRRRRREVADLLRAVGFALPPLVHRHASVEPTASVGDGAQIMAGAVVSTNAVIGDLCIVNYNAVVSHDCRLAENVNVAPGALLGGWVSVGPHALIGMGVTVYRGVKIGADVLVTNGCQVLSDVPDGNVVRRFVSAARPGDL